MQQLVASFDRAPELRTLMEVLPAKALTIALTALAGAFRIVDETGETLLSGGDQNSLSSDQVPIEYDLETIGWLSVGAVSTVHAAALVPLLRVLLQTAGRCQMTADLHLATVHEDYRKLLAKHAELAESENRYRLLSQHLEARVREQVSAIEEAQRQLFHAEKMASVGQLAAGMAHEINNPIGFVRSNLTTAQEYVRRIAELAPPLSAGDAKAAAAVWARHDLEFVLQDFVGLLEESASGADRVARIVADLKAFSSVDAAEETEVDLNASVRSVAQIVQTQVAAGTRLALELQPLRHVRGKPTAVNQMLLAVAQNALLAVAGRADGLVRLATGNNPSGVWVEVSDNGPGMRPEVLARAFDPFFTTRDVGRGTGLGLTVSRDIVRAHGGRIELSSEPGRGTRVLIQLPLQRPQADTSGEKS